MKQLFKDFAQRAADWRAAHNKSPDDIPSLDDLYTRDEQKSRIEESGVLRKTIDGNTSATRRGQS